LSGAARSSRQPVEIVFIFFAGFAVIQLIGFVGIRSLPPVPACFVL